MRRRFAVAACTWGLLALAPSRPGLAAPAPAATATPATPAVTAAAPALAQPAGRWTVEDLVLAESAEGWTVSPNGELAAWVRSGIERVGDPGQEERVTNLWLSRLKTAESVELTHGTDAIAHPLFSPDGRDIAFLSNRTPSAHRAVGAGAPTAEDAEVQLWVLPLGGGEAVAVTRFERDILDFGWLDSETFLVLSRESPAWRERERKERQDTGVALDDPKDEPPVRLFRVSRDGREVRRLTTNGDWMEELTVSPDGRYAVVLAEQSLAYKFDQKARPRTYLVTTANGSLQPLFADTADTALVPRTVQWAPDSSGFYFADDRSSHAVYRMATVADLHFYSLADKRAERIDLGWERGLGTGFAALPDGFVALLADGVHQRAVRYLRPAKKTGAGGWRRVDLTGKHAGSLDGLVVAPTGHTLIYQTSTAASAPHAYVARLDGARLSGERQLADWNSTLRAKPAGKTEVVHWPGAKGEAVEGLLHYPFDWKAGEKRPLVLDIHGGPNDCDRDAWRADWSDPLPLWRQRGAFVLQANYHGSSCYGLAWVESIAGHYYELEIPDLEAGVDAAIARGLVDPERVGVAGWSNGGILSLGLITHTRRYRAASVGAADVEWFSDWGNVDFGAAFDNYYFGGPPWEKPLVYLEKSPFFRLPEVTTPTLIFTGTEDRNVPPHESQSLFRALQQIGKAPSRLVVFPGEPHALGKVAHQRRKLEEDLAWFDRYLFAKEPAKHSVIKEGTPLAALFGLHRAARVGAVFGRKENGTLIPETVRLHDIEGLDGVEVGRFEVTRAQFAAFDPGLPVEAGQENLPMTGLDFARAKQYVEWLAKATGRPYRLPTEEEARDLADVAGTGGNTLDHWVGYTPNPEDRREIEAAVKGLSGPTPLLLPAGTFPGFGEDPVFDLDGNAAEWAVGAKHQGVAVGASADRPGDTRSEEAASADYVGLRVVLRP